MKRSKFNLNYGIYYGHKFKVLGIIMLLICGIIYMFNSKIMLVSESVNLWLLCFSLVIINFSKEKNEEENDVLIRYYAGRLTVTFIIGLVLSISLINILMNHKVHIENLILALVGLSFYAIIFNWIKYISNGKEIKVIENGVLATIKSNTKLIYSLALLTFITIILIIVFLQK